MSSVPSALSPSATSRDRTAHLLLLQRFLTEVMPVAAAEAVTPATALLSTGLLDSMSVIQLMVFLSKEFGIEIDDEDFVPENLATVGQLLDFIDRKKAAQA